MAEDSNKSEPQELCPSPAGLALSIHDHQALEPAVSPVADYSKVEYLVPSDSEEDLEDEEAMEYAYAQDGQAAGAEGLRDEVPMSPASPTDSISKKTAKNKAKKAKQKAKAKEKKSAAAALVGGDSASSSRPQTPMSPASPSSPMSGFFSGETGNDTEATTSSTKSKSKKKKAKKSSISEAILPEPVVESLDSKVEEPLPVSEAQVEEAKIAEAEEPTEPVQSTAELPSEPAVQVEQSSETAANEATEEPSNQTTIESHTPSEPVETTEEPVSQSVAEAQQLDEPTQSIEEPPSQSIVEVEQPSEPIQPTEEPSNQPMIEAEQSKEPEQLTEEPSTQEVAEIVKTSEPTQSSDEPPSQPIMAVERPKGPPVEEPLSQPSEPIQPTEEPPSEPIVEAEKAKEPEQSTADIQPMVEESIIDQPGNEEPASVPTSLPEAEEAPLVSEDQIDAGKAEDSHAEGEKVDEVKVEESQADNELLRADDSVVEEKSASADASKTESEARAIISQDSETPVSDIQPSEAAETQTTEASEAPISQFQEAQTVDAKEIPVETAVSEVPVSQDEGLVEEAQIIKAKEEPVSEAPVSEAEPLKEAQTIETKEVPASKVEGSVEEAQTVKTTKAPVGEVDDSVREAQTIETKEVPFSEVEEPVEEAQAIETNETNEVSASEVEPIKEAQAVESNETIEVPASEAETVEEAQTIKTKEVPASKVEGSVEEAQTIETTEAPVGEVDDSVREAQTIETNEVPASEVEPVKEAQAVESNETKEVPASEAEPVEEAEATEANEASVGDVEKAAEEAQVVEAKETPAEAPLNEIGEPVEETQSKEVPAIEAPASEVEEAQTTESDSINASEAQAQASESQPTEVNVPQTIEVSEDQVSVESSQPLTEDLSPTSEVQAESQVDESKVKDDQVDQPSNEEPTDNLPAPIATEDKTEKGQVEQPVIEESAPEVIAQEPAEELTSQEPVQEVLPEKTSDESKDEQPNSDEPVEDISSPEPAQETLADDESKIDQYAVEEPAQETISQNQDREVVAAAEAEAPIETEALIETLAEPEQSAVVDEVKESKSDDLKKPGEIPCVVLGDDSPPTVQGVVGENHVASTNPVCASSPVSERELPQSSQGNDVEETTAGEVTPSPSTIEDQEVTLSLPSPVEIEEQQPPMADISSSIVRNDTPEAILNKSNLSDTPLDATPVQIGAADNEVPTEAPVSEEHVPKALINESASDALDSKDIEVQTGKDEDESKMAVAAAVAAAGAAAGSLLAGSAVLEATREVQSQPEVSQSEDISKSIPKEPSAHDLPPSSTNPNPNVANTVQPSENSPSAGSQYGTFQTSDQQVAAQESKGERERANDGAESSARSLKSVMVKDEVVKPSPASTTSDTHNPLEPPSGSEPLTTAASDDSDPVVAQQEGEHDIGPGDEDTGGDDHDVEAAVTEITADGKETTTLLSPAMDSPNLDPVDTPNDISSQAISSMTQEDETTEMPMIEAIDDLTGTNLDHETRPGSPKLPNDQSGLADATDEATIGEETTGDDSGQDQPSVAVSGYDAQLLSIGEEHSAPMPIVEASSDIPVQDPTAPLVDDLATVEPDAQSSPSTEDSDSQPLIVRQDAAEIKAPEDPQSQQASRSPSPTPGDGDELAAPGEPIIEASDLPSMVLQEPTVYAPPEVDETSLESQVEQAIESESSQIIKNDTAPDDGDNPLPPQDRSASAEEHKPIPSQEAPSDRPPESIEAKTEDAPRSIIGDEHVDSPQCSEETEPAPQGTVQDLAVELNSDRTIDCPDPSQGIEPASEPFEQSLQHKPAMDVTDGADQSGGNSGTNQNVEGTDEAPADATSTMEPPLVEPLSDEPPADMTPVNRPPADEPPTRDLHHSLNSDTTGEAGQTGDFSDTKQDTYSELEPPAEGLEDGPSNGDAGEPDQPDKGSGSEISAADLDLQPPSSQDGHSQTAAPVLPEEIEGPESDDLPSSVVQDLPEDEAASTAIADLKDQFQEDSEPIDTMSAPETVEDAEQTSEIAADVATTPEQTMPFLSDTQEKESTPTSSPVLGASIPDPVSTKTQESTPDLQGDENPATFHAVDPLPSEVEVESMEITEPLCEQPEEDEISKPPNAMTEPDLQGAPQTDEQKSVLAESGIPDSQSTSDSDVTQGSQCLNSPSTDQDESSTHEPDSELDPADADEPTRGVAKPEALDSQSAPEPDAEQEVSHPEVPPAGPELAESADDFEPVRDSNVSMAPDNDDLSDVTAKGDPISESPTSSEVRPLDASPQDAPGGVSEPSKELEATEAEVQQTVEDSGSNAVVATRFEDDVEFPSTEEVIIDQPEPSDEPEIHADLVVSAAGDGDEDLKEVVVATAAATALLAAAEVALHDVDDGDKVQTLPESQDSIELDKACSADNGAVPVDVESTPKLGEEVPNLPQDALPESSVAKDKPVSDAVLDGDFKPRASRRDSSTQTEDLWRPKTSATRNVTPAVVLPDPTDLEGKSRSRANVSRSGSRRSVQSAEEVVAAAVIIRAAADTLGQTSTRVADAFKDLKQQKNTEDALSVNRRRRGTGNAARNLPDSSTNRLTGVDKTSKTDDKPLRTPHQHRSSHGSRSSRPSTRDSGSKRHSSHRHRHEGDRAAEQDSPQTPPRTRDNADSSHRPRKERTPEEQADHDRRKEERRLAREKAKADSSAPEPKGKDVEASPKLERRSSRRHSSTRRENVPVTASKDRTGSTAPPQASKKFFDKIGTSVVEGFGGPLTREPSKDGSLRRSSSQTIRRSLSQLRKARVDESVKANMDKEEKERPRPSKSNSTSTANGQSSTTDRDDKHRKSRMEKREKEDAAIVKEEKKEKKAGGLKGMFKKIFG